MIRPRKLLFMAIDGVAPRAKMNQQRSRRFRSAKERRDKLQAKVDLKLEMAAAKVSDEDDETNGDEHFDTNCITPGTKFMALVSASIKYYIVDRMNREPVWRRIKVIFSDANVPGEGEHKIVDYIRRQRLDPDYDANTKHVIHGLDADLIMLSMATHEPYFKVLREDVFYEESIKYNPCAYCGFKGHAADFCPRRAENEEGFNLPVLNGKPHIFLDVAVLREYLNAELKPDSPLSFQFDLERAIDDWIFMCFFVGNDFLPHLPSLEIREGAIDTLIESYKANASQMGGYICDNGKVDLSRAQYILRDIGVVEQKIFQKRKEKEERRDANIKRRQQEEEFRQNRAASSVISNEKSPSSVKILPVKEASLSLEENREIVKQRREANINAAQQLKIGLGQKRVLQPEEDRLVDEVRLWEAGYKERYYQSKFHFDVSLYPERAANICSAYLEGLCWVMAYYYQGCPSWKWFYPYHYAPFASDLMENIPETPFQFELGDPFRPFDQLMGVFPADSCELVPEPFRRLMTDPDSEIIDFYPEEFAVDLNGKKQAWQGVVLLPFIEETRLLTALEQVYPELDKADMDMNIRGEDRVYFSNSHHAIQLLNMNDCIKHPIPLNPSITDGLAGYIQIDPVFPLDVYPSPLENAGCPDIHKHCVISFIYFVPYHERRQLRHKAHLLPEAVLPPAVLTAEDVANIRSGAASRRVPGRLIFDRPASASERYGHHSMHQEYSREYEIRDSGQYRNYRNRDEKQSYKNRYESYSDRYSYRYNRRSRSPPVPRSSEYGNHGYPDGNHHWPPIEDSHAQQRRRQSRPYYPPPSNNPFDVLASAGGARPPPPPASMPTSMQPTNSSFYQPFSGNIDNLYGFGTNTDSNDYNRYSPQS